MSNVLFLSSRWIDSGAVTASTTRGMLTADHVQRYRPDQVWRATGCAAEYLAWDYGVALVVEALAIVGHNLSALATLRLRLASSAADVTAAPAVDTGPVSAWPSSGKPTDPEWPSYFSLILAPNSNAYRYGRLDIADPTNPDGRVQIGRLFAGPAFVPTYNVDFTWSLGIISPGEVVYSPFGRTFMDDRGPASRTMQLPFTGMNEHELVGELLELERYCGIARDFAFCVDPEETTLFHKYSGQFRFESLQAGQGMPFWSPTDRVWTKTITQVEVL